ncbi:jerky protein homolog-like [Macrosteles quadrilineatus]|uniref:jerky protein homolog-like n=1 Tax=Macrosteles quadrilineatus TaxID=74068 RepID=UPI0023E33614|nr:jerky protein homolog-like [Macrosteles quadrilineatus]
MQQRLQALERIDKDESVQSICTDLGVGKSTVNDWRQNRKSIEDFCTQIESEKALSSRCTLKKPKNELVNDALWVWFMQERRRGTPISGPILKEKAVILHGKLGEEGEFVASEGWLSRWKKRHGVHFLGVCGEKLSADPAGAAEFTKKFEQIIAENNLSPEQVYNIDETGLYYKLLPRKTFAAATEMSAPGFKVSKDRITVALCSNASGTHKLPLFVIGKSAKPRAFKNLDVSKLPVYYRAQKSAWMDSYLFKEWFISEFVPKVKSRLMSSKLPVNALLVLDNAPTHPDELECDCESGIKLYYLPPNVTSLQQPMDQGVIECFKRNENVELEDVLERVTVEKEVDSEILNDEEIAQSVLQRQETQEGEEEEGGDRDEDDECKMSHAEGMAALQLATTYIEQQTSSTAVDLMLFRKWRDYARKKSTEEKVQRKITDFF